MALRNSEEHFRLTFHTSPDAINVNQMVDGLYVDINEGFTRLTGFTREDVIGRTSLERSIWVNPADREELVRGLRENGCYNNLEAEFRRKDGSTARGIMSARIMMIRDVPHIISVTRDITQLRHVEEERRKLEERLQRSEKMESLGILAGGVAHDLNNVLGVLVGYSELILMEIEQDSRLKDHVKNIMRAGERAGAIVQDLLTLARRGALARQAVDLNIVITNQLHTPEFVSLTGAHPEIRLAVELEPDLFNVLGSVIHIEKTFLNLVINSVEAMPSGGTLTIRTENRYVDRPIDGYEQVRPGDYVVMSVSDTGQGISPEDMKRIFEPFYTKKIMGRSGTGLGLAVVWGTVKDHGGYIDVRSTPGSGTVFSLYLPVTREEVTAQSSPPVQGDYLGHGETVLVVDDMQEQRDLAVHMLRKLNYDVRVAASGEEAVEYLREHEVNLVVLDMIMDPGMDGLDTYRRILEIRPGQKAIIVSGFAETERVRIAQELGAGDYVKKPYVLHRIGTAIHKELMK